MARAAPANASTTLTPAHRTPCAPPSNDAYSADDDEAPTIPATATTERIKESQAGSEAFQSADGPASLRRLSEAAACQGMCAPFREGAL